MKSEIFRTAILTRRKLEFVYDLNRLSIEPYYIAVERNGKKVIYGKLNHSSEIKKFEYRKMVNIKLLMSNKFSPVIPIIPMAS